MSDTEQASTDELGMLGRWSRRKQQVARGETVEDEPVVAAPTAIEADARQAEQPVEPELTDADMPPIEAIDEHSDLSMFFSSKVSEALRQQALRRYFHLPGVHVVDRLNEYEGDFSAFQPLGDLVPEEMKRKLAYEAERLGKKLLGDGEVAAAATPAVDGESADGASSVAATANENKEQEAGA